MKKHYVSRIIGLVVLAAMAVGFFVFGIWMMESYVIVHPGQTYAEAALAKDQMGYIILGLSLVSTLLLGREVRNANKDWDEDARYLNRQLEIDTSFPDTDEYW